MAFPNEVIRWTISLGSIDISNLVLDISTDRKTTDYPFFGRTQAGGATVVFEDPVGDFSPSKSDNWFLQNGLDQDGFGVSIQIRVGTIIIFTGIIDKIIVGDKTAQIECLDGQHELGIKSVTDFGITRDFRMQLDPTDETNGVYPNRSGIAPLSRDSITINKSATETVTIVDEVKNRGILSSDNVQITDEAVISEGSPIEATSPFPRMQAKSAYRWIEADDAVTKLITDANISQHTIEVPPRTTDLHSIIVGRPGYETILGSIGQSQRLTWVGVVTDIVLEGNFIYFALSVNRDMTYFSRILRYDKRDDSWEEWFVHTVSKRQIFNMVFLGTDLLFTASDARNKSDTNKTPVVGSYDSAVAVADRKCLIQRIDTTQSSLSAVDLVAKNATYPIQIGTYRQFGTSDSLSTSGSEYLAQNIVPDTQRKLLVSGSNFYYYYARKLSDETIEAGIAKSTIAGTPTQKFHHACTENNQYHGNFTISGSKIYYSTTFLKQGASEWRTVEGDL